MSGTPNIKDKKYNKSRIELQKRVYIETDKQTSYLAEVLLDKMNDQGLDIKQLLELVRMLIPSQVPEQFYSIEETSKILKMPVRTLYNARLNGDIHWREYKGNVWFSKQDIEEFQLRCRK